MITAASLRIAIGTEGAQRSAAEIRSVGDAVEATGQRSQGAGQRIGAAGEAIRNVGLGMTAGVTLPIIALGRGIVGMASDTNEALSAVKTVYGSAAAGVIQSSQGAATAVGLSQNQYLSATTGLAAYGKMMGLTQAQTATFADQTVTAAADLASFYNTSPEDAMGAITAGLRGEGDALERYGIIMNQSTVEAYALAQGIWDGNGAMTTQQLETARSGFIMDQLTSSTGSANAAHGDFARTSGGLANQQRILKAELKDVGAQFGAVLLPLALKMVGGFQKVIGVMRDLSPHAKAVVVVIAGIAAAIGPALIGIGTLLPAMANGFRVARIAMLAFTGPIGLIVAALVGLGIAYKTNFLGFGDAVRFVGSILADFGRYIQAVVQDGDYLNDWLMGIPGPIRGVVLEIGKIVAAILDFGRYMRAVVQDGDYLNDFLLGIPAPLRGVVEGIGKTIAAVMDFGRYLKAVVQDGDYLNDWLMGIPEPVRGVVLAIGKLIAAFGEGGLMGVLGALPGLVADAISGLAGMALDLGGWVLNVGLPAVGGWLLGGLTAVTDWIFAALGDAAGLALDFAGWTLAVAMPTVGGWLAGGVTGVIDWIKGRLGIGSVAASPDGIPTGGGNTEITWGSWILSVAAPMVGGWLSGGAGLVLDWIKGKLGIGSVAASPDGIPTGGGGTEVTWGSWVLTVGLPTVGGWLATAFSGVFELIKAFLPAAGATLGTLASWGLDVALPVIGGWLATAFTGIFDLIRGFLPAAGTKLGDIASWALDVALPTVGGWLATAYTGVFGLVAGFLPGAGTKLGDIASWVMDVALPTIGGWLATAYQSVASLIQGFLPATGVTLGSITGWILDVALPTIVATGWDFLTTVAGKIAEWAVAAAGYVIHWGGWSVAVEWATDVAHGAWDFLTNVAGKLAEWAIAAVGYVLHWGGWSVTVGWATDVVKGAWDFLTNVASALWVWVKGAAGYMVTWAGWSVTIGFATQIIKGAWDFLTNVATAIWGWLQGAAGYVIEWAGWSLTVGQGAVTSGLGVIVDWLQPYIDQFIGTPLLSILNYTLELGVPSTGITLSTDFNWTELAKGAFTGTITLDPNVKIDIKMFGAKVGSWINAGLTDPATIKWIAIGMAALVGLIFLGPEAVLAVALIAAAKPVGEAIGTFFEGVFSTIDFGAIFDGIMNEITGGLANVLDGIASALDAAPDWAVPDGLVTDIRGWGADLRALGEENGTAFNKALRDAIDNGTLPGGGDPALVNGSMGNPFPQTPGAPTLPGGAQGPVNPSAPTLPGGLQGPVQTTGGKFAGGIFADIIAQATEAKRQFGELLTGIGTDSDTAKTAVVGSLTGMGLEGLPPVVSLATEVGGQFVTLHATSLAEATGLSSGVKAQFGDMQLGASGSAALTQAGVSTAFATMSATGKGHAASLSNQALGSFAALKSGATGAAGQTATDVVGKLGVMAVGGGQKAAELMGSVKNNIANSGAAGTAYSVGSNIGASLSSGLSAWLPTIRSVAADMIAAVDGAMRKKAMIASPSKLFRQTGSYLGEGLVLGVQDWLGAAGRMGDRLIDSVGPAALPALGTAGFGGSSGSSGYGGGSSAPIIDRGRPVTHVTHNNTYHMTVSVKDVEEMIRLGKFVDDLPAAASLVFGNSSGQGA